LSCFKIVHPAPFILSVVPKILEKGKLPIGKNRKNVEEEKHFEMKKQQVNAKKREKIEMT